MATSTVDSDAPSSPIPLQPVLIFNILVAIQLVAALVYGTIFEIRPATLHLFLIPFIWIAVSVMAVWYTQVPAATGRRQLVAGAISGGFFLVFLYLSGAAGTATELFEPLTGSSGVAITTDRSLGWSPILFYSGEWVAMRIIPYQLIGYFALSYLIYAAILDITRSAKAGLLGLALCPGCTVALFAPVFASAAGLSSAFTFFVRYTYEISTVLFVLAVALLYFEPSVREIRTSVRGHVPQITVGVGIVVAWTHLFHPQYGVFRLIRYAEIGILLDPRPIAFTLAGLAIFAGIMLAYAGYAREYLYLGGMALMVVFIFGYAAWHTVLDHGAFWPHIHAHGHGGNPLYIVASHLVGDQYALITKLAEVTLLALLIVLYRRE